MANLSAALLDDGQQESSEGGSISTTTPGIEIAAQGSISTVALLADGESVLGGGSEGKIWRWRVEDGKEIGKPMEVGGYLLSLALSHDNRWMVAGTKSGKVVVWNTIAPVTVVAEFNAHEHWVRVVDISPDDKKIATGSNDKTLCVWWLRTGKRLLGPLEHDHWVIAVKFSLDGHFIATATWDHSVRVYDGNEGHLLADFQIEVNSPGSLSWAQDSSRLFALSRDGHIHYVDASTKKQLAKWRIHSDNNPSCIALVNDTVIVASAGSMLSFWDTATHQQIEIVLQYVHPISVMTVSSHSIVTAGDNKITLRNLSIILRPPQYNDERFVRELHRLKTEKSDTSDILVAFCKDARQKHDAIYDEEIAQGPRDRLVASNEQKESSNPEIVRLNKTIQELRHELASSQQAVDQLAKKISSLRANLDAHETRSADHEQTIQKLRDALCDAHSTILSLTPSPPESVLMGWAKTSLVRFSVSQALDAANKFNLSKFHVYRAICEALEGENRVTDSIDCFQKMRNELVYQQSEWEIGFEQRCIKKLKKGGDAAMESRNHSVALISYSSILSLYSESDINDIIVQCCKARMLFLEEELSKAILATERDPSNYKGFKRKYSVLHGMGRYKEAFDAFQMMLWKIEILSDSLLRTALRSRYLDATPLIRKVIEQTIYDIPRALIDTTTGRLLDKMQQGAAFERLPVFNELRSLMTTHDRLDRARIKSEVEKFYEYVMFSHRWQPPEPSFQMIEESSIYELPTSLMIDKLVNFCRLVRSRGFRWAWSDTCCVDQSNKGVQQESIVAMFRWYCRAALTIVHLLGVTSGSQVPGSLWRSVWNTRGWTYQEYVASRIIQFYTEDWKPYLDLGMFNHKESPIILAEMEQATKFATHDLATLQPGLMKAREKLYLASRRETTREEDTAYSLFGIFDVALPVIYGEGKQAVGRFLEHILPRSNDVTLLAWTGISGGHHSYLPSDLTVYDQILPPHIPPPIEDTDMEQTAMEWKSPVAESSLAVEFYQHLYNLPSLSVDSGRLRLSGLVFPLGGLAISLLAPDPNSGLYVYHATTALLGDVRIESKDDSLATQRLISIHPWISHLIDEDIEGDQDLFDLSARARRLVVRLRQSFGALLLASQGRLHYKRVATDSLIRVQISKEISLKELMDSVRTVEVQ